MKKLLLSLLIAVTSFSVSANGFPERTVKIVVPSGPGGGIDVLARAIATKLDKIWKSGTIVENRPGGGTTLATNSVLEAPADGYTLMFYSASAYAAERGAGSSNFDWEDHFTVLSHLYAGPFVLVTNSAKNVKTLNELAELGREKGLTYGTSIPGSPLHIYGAVAAEKMNVKGITVPYKAVPQVVNDLLNNQLDYAVLSYSSVAQLINTKALTPLYVFDAERLPEFPNLPTLKNLGMPEYQNVRNGMNFFVRNDTPESVKKQLLQDIEEAIRQALPEIQQKNMVSRHAEAKLDLDAVKAISRAQKAAAAKFVAK